MTGSRTKQGVKDYLPLKRRLRNQLTSAERKLWSRLRGRHVRSLKFRRQHGIGPYIVDFYCPERKLAIEIDGDVHALPLQQIKDSQRETYLENLGVKIVRYTNNDVLNNLDGVLQDLFSKLN